MKWTSVCIAPFPFEQYSWWRSKAHCLTDDKFAALGRALDGAEADHPVTVAVVRFLLYTGARKSEVVRL